MDTQVCLYTPLLKGTLFTMDCLTEAEFKASGTVTCVGTKLIYRWFLCQSRRSLVAPRNARKPFSSVGTGGAAGRHSQQWDCQRKSSAS